MESWRIKRKELEKRLPTGSVSGISFNPRKRGRARARFHRHDSGRTTDQLLKQGWDSPG